MTTKPRKSLSVRLQPYADSPLSEVIEYLNGMDKEELNRKVGDILVMCLLPYARLHANELEENLRITCLEACDAMDKHASTMRQALKVPQIQFVQPPVMPTAGSASFTRAPGVSPAEPSSTEEPNTALRPSIQDQGSIAEIDRLFG